MRGQVEEEEGDTVGEDDWFILPLDVVAVLPGQHVHLPLVHAQLTDVGLRGDKEGEWRMFTPNQCSVEVEGKL